MGALQVVTPTYLIIAAGDPSLIALAAGLCFFGFTHLWVGIDAITGWGNEGLGWFSLIVALAAVGFTIHSWVEAGDRLAPPFGVLAAGLGLLIVAASGPLSRSLSAPPSTVPSSPGTASGVR